MKTNIVEMPAASKTSQANGLAMVEKMFFGAGLKPALDVVRRLVEEDQARSPFAVCDVGVPAVGLGIASEGKASIESFSPPAAWNVSYSVQQITLYPSTDSNYLFHAGEELLVPIEGEVGCTFFYTPGGRAPKQETVRLRAKPGAALRINPQIPHNIWSANGVSRAWLMLRHASNSPAALSIDQGSSGIYSNRRVAEVKRRGRDSTNNAFTRRAVTEAELRRPGTYALIAWGIADAIRSARRKASLTTTELAKLINIDPSSLSRLEEAKANISIELLTKVCNALRIGIGDRIEASAWLCDKSESAAKGAVSGARLLPTARGGHFLHPFLHHLPARTTRSVYTGKTKDPRQVSSWVLVQGRLIVEFPKGMSRKPIFMETGNVLHFRQQAHIQLRTLEKSTLVQIVHSDDCVCDCVEKK